MGDPSGIGPEVIVKALANPEVGTLADFVVIGDREVLERAGKIENRTARIEGFKVIDLQNVDKRGFRFGEVNPAYGRASLEYIEKAMELIQSHEIDCIVTGPVSKEAITLAGYAFIGHTEYIAKAFKAQGVVMMLLNEKLRVSLVTRHIPLKDVPRNITTKEIFKTVAQTAAGLRTYFGLTRPHLGVCGLNPHASDNGIIGDEEKCLITPAIEKAQRKGIMVSGPFPADTIFEKALNRRYDCVVCMYHDQGLIPLKLTGFSDCVNITLGLPCVRTSPGHGTAFDIAGKNKANSSSFIHAIKIALQCAKNLKKT